MSVCTRLSISRLPNQGITASTPALAPCRACGRPGWVTCHAPLIERSGGHSRPEQSGGRADPEDADVGDAKCIHGRDTISRIRIDDASATIVRTRAGKLRRVFAPASRSRPVRSGLNRIRLGNSPQRVYADERLVPPGLAGPGSDLGRRSRRFYRPPLYVRSPVAMRQISQLRHILARRSGPARSCQSQGRAQRDPSP